MTLSVCQMHIYCLMQFLLGISLNIVYSHSAPISNPSYVFQYFPFLGRLQKNIWHQSSGIDLSSISEMQLHEIWKARRGREGPFKYLFFCSGSNARPWQASVFPVAKMDFVLAQSPVSQSGATEASVRISCSSLVSGLYLLKPEPTEQQMQPLFYWLLR